MKNYYIRLFQYEHWANSEFTSCLNDIEPSEKTISLMSHIINAQKLWLCRIKKIDCSIEVWHRYPKDELQSELKRSSSDLTEFLNGITDSELDKEIAYTNSKGETFTSKMTDILTHLILHSCYHRGQIALDIKPQTKNLPYTDYIHYVRNIIK